MTSEIKASNDYRKDTSVSGLICERTGRVVKLRLARNGALSTSGIIVPQGFRPSTEVLFVGKANYNGTDYWDWGFQILQNGTMTARSRNNNNAVEVTWTNTTVTYITNDA